MISLEKVMIIFLEILVIITWVVQFYLVAFDSLFMLVLVIVGIPVVLCHIFFQILK